MRSWRRVLLYGLGLWAGIIAVSLVLLPLEGGDDALHESLKLTAMVAIALAFTILHLRRSGQTSPGGPLAGLLVGLVWAAVVLVLDLALFATGAFTMGFADYVVDVASSYLVVPVVTTLAMGYLRAR